MKREEAKNIVINYALGQKINNGINTMENLIDKIFDEHEAQLKQAYAEAEHDQRNSAMSQKEALSLIKQLKAKEKEIAMLQNLIQTQHVLQPIKMLVCEQCGKELGGAK